MVDAVGHVFVIAKALHEENTAILVQGLGDPDGQRNSDEEVEGVGEDEWIHCFGVLFCGLDELSSFICFSKY